MCVLVLGGAGYIGSHMVRYLQDLSVPCVVIDDLSTGFEDSINGVPFYKGNFSDRELLRRVLKDHSIKSVLHFAAFSQVRESMTEPSKYYYNNLVKTQVLLEVMRQCEVSNFVFSSTAAVYGDPVCNQIDESHPLTPINPYGRSKLAVEWLLEDYSNAYGFKVMTLRYFNAAGAQPDASNGERHEPETHLIPLVLQALSGRRESISVFGNDYSTVDGSCVRDYIHILDLASAHGKALDWLERQDEGIFEPVNLGNGAGYSVIDIINTAQLVSGRLDAPRRLGDPAVLVASSSKAKKLLNWEPEFDSLGEIIEHAWNWEKKLVN